MAADDAAGNPQNSSTSLRRQITNLLSEDHSLAKDLVGPLEQAGQTTVNVVALGAGAVAIGCDATSATIVTGNHNMIGGKQLR